MPRVVSGKARGTLLNAPKGLATRPTADRVKEAIFNIISLRIPDSGFLDLFAGSGQMGIEALSRGASSAYFIDEGVDSIDCIRRNLEKTRLAEKASVSKGDFVQALMSIPKGIRFDIVYIDPPYAAAGTILSKASEILLTKNLLNDNAIVILEHSSSDDPSNFVTNLKPVRRCKYGTVMISFYERSDRDV